jgi:c-di-GMP-binding flagellar brake protein YcgR
VLASPAPLFARTHYMAELFDDRRQEPRFSHNGTYQLDTEKQGAFEGRILDLSLNGAALERADARSIELGKRHRIRLRFNDCEPFQGDALIVHVDAQRVGIEFYDMDPENFAHLTTLIEALRQSRTV